MTNDALDIEFNAFDQTKSSSGAGVADISQKYHDFKNPCWHYIETSTYIPWVSPLSVPEMSLRAHQVKDSPNSNSDFKQLPVWHSCPKDQCFILM